MKAQLETYNEPHEWVYPEDVPGYANNSCPAYQALFIPGEGSVDSHNGSHKYVVIGDITVASRAAALPQKEKTTGELLTHVTAIFLQQGFWNRLGTHLDWAGCLWPTLPYLRRIKPFFGLNPALSRSSSFSYLAYFNKIKNLR